MTSKLLHIAHEEAAVPGPGSPGAELREGTSSRYISQQADPGASWQYPCQASACAEASSRQIKRERGHAQMGYGPSSEDTSELRGVGKGDDT